MGRRRLRLNLTAGGFRGTTQIVQSFLRIAPLWPFCNANDTRRLSPTGSRRAFPAHSSGLSPTAPSLKKIVCRNIPFLACTILRYLNLVYAKKAELSRYESGFFPIILFDRKSGKSDFRASWFRFFLSRLSFGFGHILLWTSDNTEIWFLCSFPYLLFWEFDPTAMIIG